MNRLSRYSFASAANSTANNTEPRKRTILAATSFAASLAAAKGIAPYQFVTDSDALKFFADAKSIDIRVAELDNGNARNKAIVSMPDGNVYNLRVYGTGKTAVAESIVTDAELLKKCKYGYCKTGNEFVTADGVNPALYVNLADLL